jgi:hypothetical protein
MSPAIIHLTADEAVAVGTLVLAAVGALTLIANYFLLRSAHTQTEATRQSAEATQKAAEATLREAKLIRRQVEVADEQVKISERQFRAMKKQVEVAESSLRAQSVPRLIPAGMEACRIGELEPLRDQTPDTIRPVFVGVINAGNGAAVIAREYTSATCGEDGGRGSIGIVPPPALAAGGSGVIKLVPQAGEAQGISRGMSYQVTLGYRAFDLRTVTVYYSLAFEVRYLSATHWEIRVTEDA